MAKHNANGYRVEVHFYTASKVRTVSDGLSWDDAVKTAREYRGSDAKSVKIENSSGYPVKQPW